MKYTEKEVIMNGIFWIFIICAVAIGIIALGIKKRQNMLLTTVIAAIGLICSIGGICMIKLTMWRPFCIGALAVGLLLLCAGAIMALREKTE